MRIDVDVIGSDAPWAVYFNGVRLTMCKAADDVDGWVYAYFRVNDRLVLQKRYGVVRILWEGNLTRVP